MEKTSTVMNPWPGLASYSGEDGRTLYGRSRETNEVYSLIRNNLFITLYGRSGIGKTSLIKAGVSPYLKRSGYMPVYVRLAQEIRKEGETTFAGCLVRSIREAASKSYITFEEPPTVPDYLSPDALWQWFVSANLTTEDGNRIVPVIFLDQFEEVFSVDNSESILLLRQLCALIDGKRRLPDGVDGMSSRVRIVVSMRDDSLYRIEDVIDAYNLFPLRQKRYTIKSLGEKAASEVIAKPVEGLVSEEVMSQIIEKVGGMGSGGGADPAVLSLMMSELFKKSAGGPITSDLVAGMDSEIVDSFYREGTRNIPDKEMEFLETHLVTSDGRRSVVAAADMCKNVTQQHLESLLDSHILARIERGSFTDYELSHDVLCKRVTQNKLYRERRNAKKRQLMMLGGVFVLLFLLAASVLTIKELRDRRWTMLENQSRFVAEKALSLCEDGDNLLAQRLLCEVLPKDLEKEDRPYVAKAEMALRRALNNNSGILRGHTDMVHSASFSPDGKKISSASRDGTIRIWDSETGNTIRVLVGHTNSVSFVGYSPDGLKIVSASSDNTIRLWDAETGKVLLVINGHTGTVFSASFSPDGKTIVSASRDSTIRFWDVETGKALRVLHGHSGDVFSANFSSNGKRIVSSSRDGTVRIWNTENGEQIRILPDHHRWAFSANFSPDGEKIISSSPGKLTLHDMIIWNAETGEIIRTHYCNNIVDGDFKYSPDGKWILGISDNNTAKIWDAETGVELYSLTVPARELQSVSFSPDGKKVVLASCDWTVRIWDLDDRDKYLLIDTRSGILGAAWSAQYSPDGKTIISHSFDSLIRIWDADYGVLLRTLNGHTGTVCSASFSPDGKTIVSASRDNTIRVWNAKTGAQVKIIRGHSDEVISVKYSPDGNTITSTSRDKTVRIWDAETWKEIGKINKYYYFIEYSSDGTYLLLEEGGYIYVYNIKTGNIRRLFMASAENIHSIGFSHDSKKILTASEDRFICIWNAETGELLKKMKAPDYVSANYKPFDDNKIISYSGDDVIRVWNAEVGEEVFEIKPSAARVNSARFSPDGKRIVAALNDGTIRIWNYPSLQDLLDQTREKFKNNPLTPEEREKYYLQ